MVISAPVIYDKGIHIAQQTNQYGLSRYISNTIKRKIRKQCGFGITQYEHIIPEWHEAKKHNPKNMALLCGSCHDKVTRGIFSKDKIRDALLSPKCLENGYASDIFDIGKSIPTVKIGNTVWENVPIILQIEDIPILKIIKSTENKGTFEISSLFCDDNGEEIFKITNNIWEGNITNWDIETIGQTITIRKNLREIALKITIEPNNGIITINKLNMNFRGATIFGDEGNEFYAKANDGSQIRIGLGGGVKSCDIGVLVLKDSVAMGIVSKITKYRS